MNPSFESLLNFIKHPGTNVGAGLLLTAMSTVTAAIPPSQRSSDSIAGLVYAGLVKLADIYDRKVNVPKA